MNPLHKCIKAGGRLQAAGGRCKYQMNTFNLFDIYSLMSGSFIVNIVYG